MGPGRCRYEELVRPNHLPFGGQVSLDHPVVLCAEIVDRKTDERLGERIQEPKILCNAPASSSSLDPLGLGDARDTDLGKLMGTQMLKQRRRRAVQ